MKKNVVVGLGEVGGPLLRLLSGACAAAGYDADPELTDRRGLEMHRGLRTEMLHVCMPYSEGFASDVAALSAMFELEIRLVKSTVPPTTTAALQRGTDIPVVYSAVRGVSSRMLEDLRRYTKYFALEAGAPGAGRASASFAGLMKKCGVRTEQMSSPVTLELAKILVDTSYYGWLINYAQISKMIADEHGVDYDEMWEFADEIHRLLGNRPKMFPGFIGGHCVIPNLDLIGGGRLRGIGRVNDEFAGRPAPRRAAHDGAPAGE